MVRIGEVTHERAVGLFKRSCARYREEKEGGEGSEVDLGIRKNVSGNTLVGS